MKTIKDYIQFAIDNGYKLTVWKEIRVWLTTEQVLKTITSLKFIEAIARGIWKDLKVYTDEQTHVIYRRDKKDRTFIEISTLEDMITHQQSFAIRDNKLQEFINNLLTK